MRQIKFPPMWSDDPAADNDRWQAYLESLDDDEEEDGECIREEY